jgi:hypothetical protein
MNAYPTTIFFNQSRPHRYQVGVFATSMASTLLPQPSFFNQSRPHRYQVVLFATSPTSIFLQPEPKPTISLSGRRVFDQPGINATIFLLPERPHRLYLQPEWQYRFCHRHLLQFLTTPPFLDV